MILKLNKKQAYGILVISIIFEQIGTGFLEACDAFTKLTPTILLILAYIASYWFFAQLLQHINLSVSYSTWTAAGTVSAALIGLFAFGQHISPLGLARYCDHVRWHFYFKFVRHTQRGPGQG